MVALEKFGAKTAFEMGVVLALYARRSNLVSLAQKVRSAFRTLAPVEHREITVGECVRGTDTFGGYRIIKYHDFMLNVSMLSYLARFVLILFSAITTSINPRQPYTALTSATYLSHPGINGGSVSSPTEDG